MKKSQQINRTTLLLFLLLSCSLSSAQELSRKEARLYERYGAYEQIDLLRQHGVTLFRLQTSASKIAALKDCGLKEEIPKVIKEQRLKNEELVSEFREHFVFCPIYFLMSSDLAAVMGKNTQGALLGDSQQRDIFLSPELTTHSSEVPHSSRPSTTHIGRGS